MKEDKKSYQSVLKATSLFGGVQIISIIITIIRSKIIALLLGPEGVGISNLLSRPLQLITTATQLGLDKSAVKEISSQNKEKGGVPLKIIAVLKKMVWITASLGAVAMVVFSSVLSEFTFDSQDYTIAFMGLGLALVFNQLTMSNLAVLQGLRKLDFLAKATIYGSVLGLLLVIPLYFFLGLEGILPAIIASSGAIFLFAYIYAKKVVDKQLPSIKKEDILSTGRPMVKLGMALSFSSIIGLLVAYLILVFIRVQEGEVASGYYAAAMVIINTYVGLIFNAMATDYYPRLAAICDDLQSIIKTVFEQSFVATLLITPIIICFITFAPAMITVLYSGAFEPAILIVKWSILGMLFKTVSWSMGYVIIAKGDAKLFVKTSIVFNTLLLLLNIMGYYAFNLEGLGISLLVYYIIHYIVIKILVFYKYNIKMRVTFEPIFVKCLFLCVITFLATYINIALLKYMILISCLVISSLYSYKVLDKKIGFIELMNSILRSKKK